MVWCAFNCFATKHLEGFAMKIYASDTKVISTNVTAIHFNDVMKINLVVLGSIIDEQFKVTEVMSSQFTTIKNSETIRQAAESLSKGRFQALPVIDHEANIVGTVTSTDLIEYLNEQY